MSSSSSIGSFKSKADMLRKEADYRKYLRLQAKLNSNAERAAQVVTPIPLPIDMETEVQMDINQMRNAVVLRITPLLGQTGAQNFVYRYIYAKDDLMLFHSLMEEFLKIVQTDRPLNSNYLFNIYTRWLQRRKAKQDSITGEGYGSLSPTIQTEMDRMGYDVRDYVLNSGLSPIQMAKYVKMTEDAMRAYEYDTLSKIVGGRL